MQQDTIVPDLEIAAAKFALGIIQSWELPPIADAALNRGQYSDSLVELASLRGAIMSDAGPLFEASMAELKINAPSEDTAIQTVLTHYIQLIADETSSPYDGLHKMMQDVYYGADLYEKTNEYTGDSHGIQHLVGAYYGYDDLRERPHEVSFEDKYGDAAIGALDAHVIELAKEWLTQNAA